MYDRTNSQSSLTRLTRALYCLIFKVFYMEILWPLHLLYVVELVREKRKMFSYF